MHSIELLLDPATDQAIRDDWAALAAAGLPSLANHTGETNAPHVTLVARDAIDSAQDPAVAALDTELPLPLRFAGLVVFGSPPRGLVLARAVVVGRRILEFHARVHQAAPASATAVDQPHSLPDAWTPHVTLAMRLTPGQLAEAIEVLAGRPTIEGGELLALRRWDSAAKTVTMLAQDSAAGGL